MSIVGCPFRLEHWAISQQIQAEELIGFFPCDIVHPTLALAPRPAVGLAREAPTSKH